ncbi:HypC/HybG/HupF family hydrogenase formation chaperone [Pseudobacteroides cellulosolvens]|uniref:Hydrogenase assembly chaperone hypC/hupF n=1 Tax=Pseudobacteroides cellulosolvens ATCC 35603 = DSM 2933 TaxID=398512 RepID=A0A0L6JHH5_9FIRM|nr:HypC/HybG/HupF family hydrogenase formation chaperone [Pseudobacteroides cellulosolvens]KNY24927.1 hydrogenase assembly chaperone hypC/hupF [Pseudobacteroides cellulosolvens ATCC 35603 = DSM 2933]
MCLALPGKIIEIKGKTGLVEMLGVSREVSLELIKDYKPGDYVLVHAGCAISKVDEEEAIKTIELFNELKEMDNG